MKFYQKKGNQEITIEYFFKTDSIAQKDLHLPSTMFESKTANKSAIRMRDGQIGTHLFVYYRTGERHYGFECTFSSTSERLMYKYLIHRAEEDEQYELCSFVKTLFDQNLIPSKSDLLQMIADSPSLRKNNIN